MRARSNQPQFARLGTAPRTNFRKKRAVPESLSHIPDRISDKEHIAGQLIEPCGKQ